MRYLYLLVILFVSSLAVGQQTASVRCELDSAYILVGGQIGLTVTVTAPRSADIHVLSLPDTLSSEVEVVEVLRPDTVMQGELIQYLRRYLITSFDTGLHYIAPIAVAILPDSTTASTPEFALTVVNPFQQMEYDEESGVAKITDIRDAEDAPFQWGELLQYWPWAVGVLVVVGLIVLGLYVSRKYGKREVIEEKRREPEEPCEVIAMRDLERIRSERLWMHNRVKDFYSELTDTLRVYIESRYEVSAMECTSAQLLDELRHILDGHKEEAEALKYVLELADYAKFAKMEPLPDENDRAIDKAVAFVQSTTDRHTEPAQDKETAQ